MALIRPEKYVYYFCDESSQVDDEFMAVAGLAVPDVMLPILAADLMRIKEANGNPSEVKWSGTKARRQSPEKAFADYFDDAVKAGKIHFHIRFAPFGQYDHKANLGGRADTTSKMHFQLLLHRAVRFYGRDYKLRIRPDNGHCTAGLLKQVGNLHWQGAEMYGTPTNCVDGIQCLDSKREPLLQLLDIPLGAMAALRNNRVLGPAKTDLANHVIGKRPGLDLAKNSPAAERVFSVWNALPRRPDRRGPWR